MYVCMYVTLALGLPSLLTLALTYLFPLPLLPYFPVTYLLLSSVYILCSRWPLKRGMPEPEMVQIRDGQKTGAFSRISPDILDRFSQSFHFMKALYVQMMDLYSFSNFSRDVAMSIKLCCENVINVD